MSESKTTYDFNGPVRDFRNKPLRQTDEDGQQEDVLLCNVLAQALQLAQGDSGKCWFWACRLGETGKLELDPHDHKVLLGVINRSERLVAVSKERLKEVLEPNTPPPKTS